MPLMVHGVGPVPAIPLLFEQRPQDLVAGQLHRASRSGAPRRLDVGLVNNMPDGAFKATERQFARLLAAASGAMDVRLHLFVLPEVPRGGDVRAYMAGRYQDSSALDGAGLDALIVTGAEPLAASLVDEPYWQAFMRLVDWAEHRTVSTLWSCLAAHAAVLHLDGISRRRLPEKRSGLFECVKVSADGLLDGAPAGLRVPHSRWNDLSEGDLRQHGYRIVSRSMEAGIDSFTKQWGSRFIFLQGHPEYDVDTLFREFRRDVQRSLKGDRHTLPSLPAHYFDAATESSFSSFLSRAEAGIPEDSTAFPETWSIRPALVELWRTTSRQFYRNWLMQIAEAKR